MRHHARVAFVALLALLAPALPAAAQDSARAAPAAALPAVRVTATREGPRALLELPYALTLARPDSLAALRRQGVDELLFAVPGVALANRQNPAQDPRVSVRGFGARSAFGVRGVRILQDGVPVTLPDGQTPVDVIDVEGADRVEVVRGSASSLYGNAAGGVIDVRSALPPLRSVAPYARVVGGGGVPTIGALGAAGTVGRVGYTSSLARTAGRNFRDHSDQRSTRGALRVSLAPASAPTRFTLAARLSDVSRAESPGALTRAQLDADPTQADPLSVRKRAGKTVRQGDLALSASRALGAGGALDALIYGSTRTLANPLAFATVDVDRSSGGASLRASGATELGSRAARAAAGADVQWQLDDRLESENCADAVAVTAACPGGGSLRGTRRRDQRERVTSIGPFVRGELAVAPTLLLSAGVRADAVRFVLRDRLVTATNPDDSGERTLRAVSPSAGLVWRAAPLASLYGSVSSSFETPTTTELGNRADGSAGINPELRPQRTVALELGTRGVLASLGVRWDAALFEARARDELVPFDIPNGNGRRFFRNAGRTLRRGGELGVHADAGPFALQAAYTGSRFRYVDYAVGAQSYAGNRIPGVPDHALAAAASLRRGGVTLSTTLDATGAVEVDDANSARAPGRTLVGIAVGGTLRTGRARLAPLVALQNVGGVRSVGSVSVNAAAGKYYEPAPGRTLLLRLSVAPLEGGAP